MEAEGSSGRPLTGRRYRLRDAIGALTAPPPDLTESAPVPIDGSNANHASLAWMASEAKEHVAAQAESLESLRIRAGQLAGFAAILLGLLAALVPNGLDRASTGADILAKVSFVAGLFLLLCSILIALLYVARPTRSRAVREAEHVDRFLESEAQFTAEPWQLELTSLRAFPGIIRWHGWLNRRRAAALFLAYGALAWGVVASAVCIGTLGIDA